MGGRLILAQVTSQGVKKSCKVGTWFLDKLGSMDFLNEDYFNKFAKKNKLFLETTENMAIHNSYDNDSSMFAPYHYGVIIFDFQKKKVFSCNDYNGFLIFGTSNIEMDYEKIGRVKQESYKTQDFEGKILSTTSFYEENDARIPTPRMIESCIRNKGEMYVNNTKIIISGDDDYFSIAARIYGKDLSLLSREEEKNYLKERNAIDDNKSFSHNIEDWTNIEMKKQDWEIFNGDSSSKYIELVLNEYRNKLTDQETTMWQEYIQEKIVSEK